MKKAYTRGEKWLFASPLLFLVVAGVAWVRQKTSSYSLELPEYYRVANMEFSPDGEQLAVFPYSRQPLNFAGWVYHLNSRSVRTVLKHPDVLQKGATFRNGGWGYSPHAWSPDGGSIVAILDTGRSLRLKEITIWDAGNGDVKAEYPYKRIRSKKFRFSPDGKTLVGEGLPPSRIDVATGLPLNKPDNFFNQYSSQLNEKLGLVASSESNFRVRDFKTRRVVWDSQIRTTEEFDWYDDTVCAETPYPYNSGLGAPSNRLVIWDGQTRQPLYSPREPNSVEISNFAFNAQKSIVAYSLVQWTKPANNRAIERKLRELVLWDFRANKTKRIPLPLCGSSDPTGYFSLEWSPNGEWLVAGEGLGGRNYTQAMLSILDKNGEFQWSRQVAGWLHRWSPDSKRLAIIVGAVDDSTKTIEIHRFEQ